MRPPSPPPCPTARATSARARTPVRQRLARFVEPCYLHQTIGRRTDGTLLRFADLPAALAADVAAEAVTEWRVHFHVPVFLTDLGGYFGTTRFALEQALAVHKKTPLSTHLEIETYTWDVLPEHLKDGDITDYVTRELEFMRDTLRSAQEDLTGS